MVIGDINNDGLVDVLISTERFTYVYLGLGGEGFERVGAHPPITDCQMMELWDLDGDNDLDLVAVSAYLGEILVYENLGGGDFEMSELPEVPTSLVLGDVDNDGDQDVVFSLVVPDGVDLMAVKLNDGNGLFQPTVTYPLAEFASGQSILVDLDNDGSLDFALSDLRTDTLLISFNFGDGTFLPPQLVPVPSLGRGIASGDLNQDGYTDLVVTQDEVSSIAVFLNHGGFLDEFVEYSTGEYPTDISIKDLNNDSFLDIAIANLDEWDVEILFNAGDGTFPRVDYPTGTEPRTAAYVDINHDGHGDMLTVNDDSRDVSVLLGLPDGSFLPKVDYEMGSRPTNIDVKDFNGDGDLDIATSLYSTSDDELAIRLGNGDGTFQEAATFGINGLRCFDLVSEDYDSDGDVDMWVGRSDRAELQLFVNDGQGVFTSGVSVELEHDPTSLRLEDLNNDGLKDLIVTHSRTSSLSILFRAPDSTFSGSLSIAASQYLVGIDVEDVDQNGFLDVVSTRTIGNQFMVLKNNGDETFSDPVFYSMPSYANSPVFSDLSGDGVAELLIANLHSDLISIYGNNGAGEFSLIESVHTENDAGPTWVAANDLDGDGLKDLLVLNRWDSSVSKFFANQNGNYVGKTVRLPLVRSPIDIATADLNQDGIIDLVAVGNSTSSTTNSQASIFYGTGRGFFSPRLDFPLDGSVREVEILDLDGDSDNDIAAPIQGDYLRIFRNDQQAGFSVVDIPLENWPSNFRFGMGDLNGDQLPDFLTALSGHKNYIQYKNLGDLNFVQSNAIRIEEGVSKFDVADINGDGHADLAVPDPENDVVWVLFGQGDLNFSVGQQLTSDQSLPCEANFADLDGDDDLDLLVTRRYDFDDYLSPEHVIFKNNGFGQFEFDRSIQLEAAFGGFDQTVVIDVNEDSELDIVSSFRSWLFVSLGNQGEFSEPERQWLGAIESFTLGDWNQDSVLDFAAASYHFGSGVKVSFGLGEGRWETPDILSTSTIMGLRIADFDHDQKNDLVTGGSSLQIFFGESGGLSFEPTEVSSESSSELEVADIDQDGNTDIFASSAVYYNQGDGTFSAPSFLPMESTAIVASIHDFDGNGQMDLVYNNRNSLRDIYLLRDISGDLSSELIASVRNLVDVIGAELDNNQSLDLVTLQDGKLVPFFNNLGSFTEGAAITPTDDPFDYFVAADFDGDGDDDLVAGNDEIGEVIENLGDGNFVVKSVCEFNNNPVSCTIADLNRDGMLDLVLSGVETVSIFKTLGVLSSSIWATIIREPLESQ